jgi:hypothetical protein
MIHRLGMYYLAVQLQHDQDADAARRKREGLDMLVGVSAAVAAAIGAVALVLWAAA